MPFVTTVNYPAIRAVLDVTLDSDKLLDETIASAAYHPAAEAEVARRLGPLLDAAQAAVDTSGAQRAVILLTAARLVAALPSITLRRLLDSETRYDRQAVAERVAQLRRDGLAELVALRAQLDPTGSAVPAPTAFAVAAAGRLLGPTGVVEGVDRGL